VTAGVAALLCCWVAIICWPSRPGAARDSVPARREGGSAPRPADRVGRAVAWGRARWALVPVPGRARAARRRNRSAVLGVLDGLSGGLAVGLPAATALREAAQACAQEAVRTALASSSVEPLAGWEVPTEVPPETRRRMTADGLEGVLLLSRTWQLSERVGSPLAAAVATTADLLRAEAAARDGVEAAMAEARATVLVLVALPLLGPVLAMAIGVSPGDLYGTVPGLVSAGVGIVLLGLGAWWLRRLLHTVARAGERP